jgi:hypothetical protein
MSVAIAEQTRFKYEELSDEAKEKVKQWWYEDGAEHEWWDCVYEDAKEQGKELGFDIGRINFSGFYSQGDGACWSGQIGIVRWMRAHCKDSIALDAWAQLVDEGWLDSTLAIGYRDHPYRSGTMSVSWYAELDGIEDNEVEGECIFKGMPANELVKLITSSDLEYKSMADLTEAIEQSAREYADKIYNQLREEYEYITSEANLIEMCEINDWRFDDEGRLV